MSAVQKVLATAPVAAALAAALTVAPLAARTHQDSSRTVWDGVYTDAQAERGAAAYRQFCASCHMPDLRGDDGPALRGAIFFARWRDHALAEILMTIVERMPKDSPASLKAQQYVDILGFLLKANEAPAGAAELPLDIDALGEIRIVSRDGVK